ncbi:PAS domain S-box protein [Methanobacterium sp. ACI-7]|uniref:PAS domain S-box protein n=1 Tax=unclassified Methanobacterium TaxID=2627676 RepID=UPI0039C43579
MEAGNVLKDSEARFRTLFEYNNDAIIIADTETGKFVDVNNKVEELTGYSKEELLNMHAGDLTAEEKKSYNLKQFDLMKNSSIRIETELLRKNGEVVPIEISNAILKIGNKKYVQGVFRDISERKKAEEGLKYQANLLNVVNDPIIATDLNLVITSWNKAAERLYGYNAEEVIGKLISSVVKSEFSDEQRKEALESLSEGYEVPLEVKQYDKQGRAINIESTTIPIFTNDKISGYVAVNHDITERKKTEKEIIESEARFRSLYENSFDAILLTKPDGSILAANPAAQQLFLMSEDEITKIGRGGLVVKDELLERAVKERDKKGKVKSEFNFRRKDGSIFLGEGTSNVFEDADGTFKTSMIIRDLTERKKTEDELRKAQDYLEDQVRGRTKELDKAYKLLKVSESQFRTLTENSIDIIARYDSDFRVQYINRGSKILGIKKEEFIGKRFRDLGIDEDLVKLWEYNLHKALKTKKIQFFEYNLPGIKEIRTFNSYIIPEISEGKVNSLLGVSRDITKRKKAEEQIKRRNLILSNINEIFQTGLKAETEEHLAQTALRIVEKITKSSFGFICELNSEGLLDTTAISFNGWEECRIPHSKQLIMSTDLPIRGIRGGVIREAKPMIFNDANKHPEWIEPPEGHTKIKSFLGVPLIYGGNVFGEIGLAHKEKDYTMEDLEAVESLSFAIVEALMSYRARNQLKEIINELGRSNQELQSFAYITSHDLQEPLRTMASYAQLLKMRYKGQLDEDADEFIDYMVDGATRMKSMVKALLDYSRVGTRGGEFTQFDGDKALNDALSNLKAAVEELNAKISSDRLPVITADEDQITRVFQNLLGNALKFRKKGIKPEIHISAQKTDNEYIFSVNDNGIGIEEQYTDRIFEIFKRLHSIGEYQGAGIGLAIVKRIIDRHGGRIWVKSSLGKGSTFYFTIPIY